MKITSPFITQALHKKFIEDYNAFTAVITKGSIDAYKQFRTRFKDKHYEARGSEDYIILLGLLKREQLLQAGAADNDIPLRGTGMLFTALLAAVAGIIVWNIAQSISTLLPDIVNVPTLLLPILLIALGITAAGLFLAVTKRQRRRNDYVLAFLDFSLETFTEV